MITPGTRVGPYDIEAPLGAGGAGQVFRARDTRLGRAVAVKVLAAAPATDQDAQRARLQREARAISQLVHPHICTLYDIGATPDGVSYLVMELIEGETLEQLIARGPLPIAQALTYAAQIAEAIGAAHRAGIVHGDLKPGNVMVTKSGVKLLDFGLATEHHQAIVAPPDDLTRTTVIGPPAELAGTLQYLAPEQIEGRPADTRSDIFACGAVVYEMIAGRKAFQGQTAASVIAAILREEPPPLSGLRPGVASALDRVVGACLAKDPAERWQSASDLARELRWMQAAAPDAAAVRPARPTWPVWLALAAALLLAVGVIARSYLAAPPPAGPQARTSVLLPEGLQFPAGNTLGGVGRFAISPDGTRLVFVGVDSSGNQMLWLRPLDSLTATPLSGTAGGSSPFWSPDSGSIAFFAQGQLKVVTLPGGDTRVIASQALNATGSWSGDTILFTPTARSPLARVSAAGGTPRTITRLDEEAGDIIHRSPFFLPDGRHFLYVAVAARTGGTSPRAVFAASIDDPEAEPRLVLENGSTARYADGYLVYLRDNTLVAQPFDPERLAVSGDPRTIADQVELTGVSSATFSVSRTGGLVYQTAGDGSQLVWVDRQGRHLESVGEPGRYGDLALSPDARQAAVSVLDPTTNTRDIWVFDLARGVRSRLTSDRAEDVSPVWSPDGSRIAFASNRTGHFDVYQTAASGIGEDELLVNDEGEGYPTTWARDGSLLMWMFAGGGSGVMRMPPGGGMLERWLSGGTRDALLSDDNRWVLYVSPESGRAEVYVTGYPAHEWRIQVSIAGGTAPRWRADGREAFYAGRDNRLMSVPLAANGSRLEVGEATPLFEIRPVSRGSFYEPAPDGQRFLVNTLRDTGAGASLTLVQNWASAIAP